MGTLFYKAAIRQIDGPHTGWFHLPPLSRMVEVSEDIDAVYLPIPYGSPQKIRYLRIGWNITIGGTHSYPDEEAGLQFQHNLRERLFGSDGTGYELDVCTIIHSGGSLTEIYRKCYLPGDGLKFTGGKTERWRDWSLTFKSRDRGRYATGTSGTAPPGGAYEIWSGRGQTITATGQSNADAASGSAVSIQVNSTAGFAVDGIYVWGTELIRVDSIDSGAGTLEITRGYGESTPHTHVAGDPLYLLGDPPDTGGAAIMAFAHLTWDDEIQVADNDTDYSQQKTLAIRAGNPRLQYFNLTAGDDGPGGAVGSETKIRVSKSARSAAGAYNEVTLAKGSTASAVVAGNLQFSDGDTLYAWPVTSGGHNNVRLNMIF